MCRKMLTFARNFHQQARYMEKEDSRTQELTVSGSEALMLALRQEGVKTIFGYPGGSIMPVYDALYDYTRGQKKAFEHILVRHEQGATHAAQGFARVSGEVGVCIVTSRPGATNTLTGVADAMLDSTPIVVIAGQVPIGALGTDAFQARIQEVRPVHAHDDDAYFRHNGAKLPNLPDNPLPDLRDLLHDHAVVLLDIL